MNHHAFSTKSTGDYDNIILYYSFYMHTPRLTDRPTSLAFLAFRFGLISTLNAAPSSVLPRRNKKKKKNDYNYNNFYTRCLRDNRTAYLALQSPPWSHKVKRRHHKYII